MQEDTEHAERGSHSAPSMRYRREPVRTPKWGQDPEPFTLNQGPRTAELRPSQPVSKTPPISR